MEYPTVESLARWRHRLAVSQSVLARALDVKQSTLSRWESEALSPSKIELRAWRNVLEVLEDCRDGE
ncbi:MAG: helix-turn-helix domain-containing protein [Acidobacteriota bacterium]|nr:helix-turn-helix domain-containing protein [Acidobacteriota bacterium]